MEQNKKYKILIIGIGGIGSWLAEFLVRSCSDKIKSLALMDADVVERGNLLRQNFRFGELAEPGEPPEPKVNCITNRLKILRDEIFLYSPESAFSIYPCDTFFVNNLEQRQNLESLFRGIPDLIFCCPDNHPARVTTLNYCDKTGAETILCGNEEIEASAIFYSPSWKDHKHRDPRLRYPEMLTSHVGDPTSCDYVAESFPQIASANMASAVSALYLFNLWFLCEHNNQDTKQFCPIEIGLRTFGSYNIKYQDD